MNITAEYIEQQTGLTEVLLIKESDSMRITANEEIPDDVVTWLKRLQSGKSLTYEQSKDIDTRESQAKTVYQKLNSGSASINEVQKVLAFLLKREFTDL